MENRAQPCRTAWVLCLSSWQNQSMLLVGLTGGIGAGKSMVAKRLAELGATVIDADELAKQVVAPDTDGLAEVVDAFGVDVLTANGTLDRAALAKRVFADTEALARLNAIVHPRVRARSAELTKQAPADAVVVQDIPLLVENGLAKDFDVVIVVSADEQIRIQRLVSRGLTESDARARMARQATEQQRRDVADVWLDNNGTPAQLIAAVNALWANRLLPLAQSEGQISKMSR